MLKRSFTGRKQSFRAYHARRRGKMTQLLPMSYFMMIDLLSASHGRERGETINQSGTARIGEDQAESVSFCAAFTIHRQEIPFSVFKLG